MPANDFHFEAIRAKLTDLKRHPEVEQEAAALEQSLRDLRARLRKLRETFSAPRTRPLPRLHGTRISGLRLAAAGLAVVALKAPRIQQRNSPASA